MSFVGLHIHSDYSLLDGASQLPQLVSRAVELGMPAIALTDHGVMYGAIELIKICRSKGIKPIIGNEMYVLNADVTVQQRGIKKYHQVVLAKNTQGYKNLVKLTTISHLKGFQGKGIFARPCINKELLEEYHEGLIVTSACLGGEVPQAILQRRMDIARQTVEWYKRVFGDDYYLEIQDHGSPEDRIVNVALVQLAREFEVKIVATNDSHFISCNDVEAHDALLCINTQKLITEDNRLRYSGTEYLKSAEEMMQLFRDHLPDEVIKEAIANTLEVAEKVEPYTGILGEPRIPDYPIPPNHTADTYLEEIAWEGLKKRLNAQGRSEIKPVYRERLEYELKMMQKMGFATYFLVVWDYIKHARDNHIPVGPGRGSAAGSLVAYALQITNIDPVHHGLLFERFLNPERKSMPDIDTDFCIDRRDEMIKYVTSKYGEEKVAQIITFNRMTSKAVLKDVARVLGIPYSKSDQMAKMIPVSRGKPTKLKVMISDQSPSPEFKQAYDNDFVPIKNDAGEEVGTIAVRQWVDMAIRIEGTNKTFGVHAAGVVISKQPLDEIVPLQRNNDGSVITQYFMEDIEALGLLKMDFLGLKNLTIIQRTLNYISQNHHIDIDPYNLAAEERKAMDILAKGSVKKMPEDVAKTYKILERGDLEGLFQLESSGMRQIVKDLKPSSIEDISSILALYRPGPLDAGLIPQFINRKHKREPIRYEHKLLEPILNETYGILVYQEQIMKMAQDLAGYSLGQADLLRRAMGKKKASEMQKHRETFIDGATRNGVPQNIAEHLFDQMVKFAEYCFNKSHSTAYGYITYQTAYLKANYPTEYMAALLTENSGNTDKVRAYIESCKHLGIDVVPPDINRSNVDFTPIENRIVFGLSAIKNVGDGAIEHLLSVREEGGPFRSLADLCDRINLQMVNSRALESLIKSGAFDSLHANRKQSIEYLNIVIPWAQDRAKNREIGQTNLFDLVNYATTESNSPSGEPAFPKGDDYAPKDKLQFEKELLGFYVSDHPLKSLLDSGILPDNVTLDKLPEQKSKAAVKVAVILINIKPHLTKKGDRMAFLLLEDLTGQIDAVVFPSSYEAVQQELKENAVVVVEGKVEKRDDQTQIIVDAIKSADDLIKPNNQPGSPSQLPPNLAASSVIQLCLTPEEICQLERLQILKGILEEYRGNQELGRVPIQAIVDGQVSPKPLVRFGSQFWVENQEAIVQQLKTSGFTVDILSIDNE